MDLNVDKVSDIIRECAAKYIMPRYKSLAAHEISTKTSPRDLVTHADLDVEAHLIKSLPGLLPGSIVIGEEGASAHPEILDQLADKNKTFWIVDPVDGTHNFVSSKREFGVMLALIEKGHTSRSWIYDVLGDEMTVAEKGGGAYANGQRLRVRPVADAKSMKGHVNPYYFPKPYKERVQGALEHFGECISLMCAAHEYLHIAKGEVQFSIYRRLKPWDHLAGALLVQEAGGYVAKWDGTPYTPADRDVGLISAADEHIWNEVHRAFLVPVIPNEA